MMPTSWKATNLGSESEMLDAERGHVGEQRFE